MICRSFTDIAFVDFQDQRNDWGSNGIVSSKQYGESLGRRPQSLNDFTKSCQRLRDADRLFNMSLIECEAKRQSFVRSLKIVR